MKLTERVYSSNAKDKSLWHLRRRLEADRARKAKLPRIEKLALIIKARNLRVAGGQCKWLWRRFEEEFPQIRKAA